MHIAFFILMAAVSISASAQTYLGELSANPHAPDSISNPYGKYGNRYSPWSVNNPHSEYGNPYSPNSVTNLYATKPPIIVSPQGGGVPRIYSRPRF